MWKLRSCGLYQCSPCVRSIVVSLIVPVAVNLIKCLSRLVRLGTPSGIGPNSVVIVPGLLDDWSGWVGVFGFVRVYWMCFLFWVSDWMLRVRLSFEDELMRMLRMGCRKLVNWLVRFYFKMRSRRYGDVGGWFFDRLFFQFFSLNLNVMWKKIGLHRTYWIHLTNGENFNIMFHFEFKLWKNSNYWIELIFYNLNYTV